MRWLTPVLVILASGCVCTSYAQAQGEDADASEVFGEWVQAASRITAFEVEWEVPTRLMARDGTVREEFLLQERFVFRWPCCFAASGRVVQPEGIAPDAQKRMRFDYDETLDAEGRHRKALIHTGHFEEYSRRESMIPFLSAKMIDAPDLLGLWLAEAATSTPAAWTADGRVVAEVAGMGLRAFLGRAPDGKGDAREGLWGVVRLEFLDKHGEIRSAWVYSELIQPEGIETAVGTRRQHESPKSNPGDPESPASLISLRAITSPDDSVFLLDADGVTSTDPKTGEIKTPDGTVVGIDEIVRRSRFPFAIILGGGVTLVVAAGLGWAVKRTKQ